MMLFNLIYQAGPGAAGGSPNALASLIPFILIGVIFYFLLIRPQNARIKKHRELLASIVRGDVVVTNGGLIGKVKKVQDDELIVSFGDSDIKVVRSMIADVRGRKATSKSASTDEKPKTAAKKS